MITFFPTLSSYKSSTPNINAVRRVLLPQPVSPTATIVSFSWIIASALIASFVTWQTLVSDSFCFLTSFLSKWLYYKRYSEILSLTPISGSFVGSPNCSISYGVKVVLRSSEGQCSRSGSTACCAWTKFSKQSLSNSSVSAKGSALADRQQWQQNTRPIHGCCLILSDSANSLQQFTTIKA